MLLMMNPMEVWLGTQQPHKRVLYMGPEVDDETCYHVLTALWVSSVGHPAVTLM